MKLKESILYRKYGEYTFVYDYKSGTKLLFNDIVYDIFNFFSGFSESEEITEYLLTLYTFDSEEEKKNFIDDISTFIAYLVSLDIIEENEETEEKDVVEDEEDVEDILKTVCDSENILEHAYFELTYRCNEKCIHCYEEHLDNTISDELTLEEVCDVLEKLKEMGVMEVTFTGGEVAVRKDFIQICEYASLLGFAIHIYTNGIGFSDQDIQRLRELNIASISFSVYSLDEAIHDSITQLKGSLKKTLYSLFAFKTMGIHTIIKTVVMKQNISSFSKIVDFCNIMGIKLETSLQLLATDTLDVRPKQFRLSEVSEYYQCMYYEAKSFGWSGLDNPFKEERKEVCGLGRSINISPSGDCFPCNVLNVPVGNVRTDDIRDIWSGEKMEVFRQFNVSQLDIECQKCDKFKYCLYCPGAMLREMGSMSKHNQVNCILAQAKKDLFENMTKE